MGIAVELCPGEDSQTLEDVLRNASAWVRNDRASLLEQDDDVRGGILRTAPAPAHAARREAILTGRAKRFVLLVSTTSGPRVVKVHEVNTLGNRVRGLLSSVSRIEHQAHYEASQRSLAAAQSCGYLELRSHGLLRRSIQVQSTVPEKPRLGAYLASHDRWDAFGAAMARQHQRQFFHADLKPYHGFVWEHEHGDGFDLRWIDFGRAAFRLSRRRRIINLYQVFRYCLPIHAEAQEIFMQSYCATSGWMTHETERALAKTRKFLRHKLRTYPLDDAPLWQQAGDALGATRG